MPSILSGRPIRVAWISDFPIEWMPEAPEEVRSLSRAHPATWQLVLQGELEKNESVELHICVLRKNVPRDLEYRVGRTTFHICKVPSGLRAPSLFWTDNIVLNRQLKLLKPDLVHAWGTERGAAMVASRMSYPTVVTMQGLLTWLASRAELSAYERFAARLERISLRRSRWVTAESRFAVDYLQRCYPRLEVTQIEHAPNWLFHRLVRQPFLEPPRLVCVASQGHVKGTDILLRGLDRILDELSFELVMIGSRNSDLLRVIEPTVSPRLWDRITMKSGLTPAEVSAEVSQAAILTLTSRADTSPNAVKEAAVAGVPVVASAIGGVPDYIQDGRNGVLFEAGDIEAFAGALRVALLDQRFRRGQVDESTLDEVRRYLSPKTMGDKFLTMYENILTQSSAN